MKGDMGGAMSGITRGLFGGNTQPFNPNAASNPGMPSQFQGMGLMGNQTMNPGQGIMPNAKPGMDMNQGGNGQQGFGRKLMGSLANNFGGGNFLG